MEHIEFINAERTEHDEFISKLLHAIHKYPQFFAYANMIVETAENADAFKDVKFGNQVPEEA
jgi:hypothetical protein